MTQESRESLYSLLQFKEIVDKDRAEWNKHLNYDVLLQNISDIAECSK